MSKNFLKIFFLIFFILAGAFLVFTKPQNPQAIKKSEKFVLGEIILKLRESPKKSSNFSLLNSRFKAQKMEPVLETRRIYKIEFEKTEDIQKIIEEYKKDPQIEWAEPNYLLEIQISPNDPSFSQQWALHNTGQIPPGGTPDADIDAPEAWDIEKGNSNVKIAVVDTGVDWNHPDLFSNIWANSADPIDGTDNDGNGYLDDFRGWDFVDIDTGAYQAAGYSLISGEDYTQRDNDPMDFHGHGTHVAGLASAVTNNGTGGAGVGWNSKIMAIRAGFTIEDSTKTSVALLEEDDLVAAMHYVADSGAEVINMSWGTNVDSSLIKEAIDYAYGKGSVLVGAAGNDNSEVPFYPAAYSNAIAVAATNQNDQKASFSNYGSWIDVSAPGVSIYSTLPDPIYDPPYGSWQGTSMATPFVSGQAALLKSHFPSWTNSQIKTQIRNTADNIDSQNPSYVGKLGKGRINLYRSLSTSFQGEISDYLKVTSFSLSPSNPVVGEEVTANFTLENQSSGAVVLDSTGVACRYGKLVRNFSPSIDITIPAQSSQPFSQKRVFNDLGKHRSWVYYYYNGQGYKVSNDKYFTTLPLTSKLKLISLSLSPSDPAMGEEVTVNFTLKNEAVSDIALDSTGVAVRYGKRIRNLTPTTGSEAIISSGQQKQFTQKRTFGGWGYYNYWPYFYYNSLGYKLTSTKSFYYYPLTYKLKLSSFSLSNYNPDPEETITTTLTLQNNMVSDLSLGSTGVAVRYGTLNKNFDSITGLEAVIPAGQSKQFNLQKSFTNIGTYKNWVYAYWGSYGFKLSSDKYFTINALVTGWLYGSNSSFTNNLSTLDEIYPFWYEVDASGTSYVKKSYITEDPNLVTTAHNNNIKVLPTITFGSGGAGTVKNMIIDPVKKTLFIDNVLSLVQAKNYDGIDLDFEDFSGTLEPYRDQFSTFVEDLSSSFHANSKLVGFAAIAKPSEPGLWSSQKYTDWTRVGPAVDRFQIMLYNYTSQNSSTPGPIAPYGWIDEVLTFAKTVMPSKKIFMGLGAWGWSWARSGSGWATPAIYWSAFGASSYATSKGISVNYSASNVKSYYGDYYYQVGYAPHFNYISSGGLSRQVWYEDYKSSSQKVDLLKAKGIGGVSIWNIGAEDPRVWSVFASKL